MDNMFLNACKNAQKGIVEAFLKKGGINVDKRDGLGNTPLYYVCSKGAKDIVKLLINAGADVNLANNTSETPLHLAARAGSKEIIKMLVDAGADVNAGNNTGQTPVFYSVLAYKTETALYLITLGADTGVKDNGGYNIFDHATANGMRELITALGEANTVQKDDHGNTPLHQAVYNNQSETVMALLKSSAANVNELNNGGVSALILAVNNSNMHVADLLIKNGADVNLHLHNGNSALHYAAGNG
ncbi:ankyrin repeat domain-containing protein [Mucilaginibacter terrae]|uniref:Ankyrin repeat protein n=1 Tax=Mucilaginibacter terrae TaxID=1955052 RepID=A0ABU3H0P8_9SPHI|nr:ankyrin repeat domain-containing protein [Mucilaginibacter terrae]MDT3405589.1 ankyrin repeat protein [Mucilaginibacter terrae]